MIFPNRSPRGARMALALDAVDDDECRSAQRAPATIDEQR